MHTEQARSNEFAMLTGHEYRDFLPKAAQS